MARNYRTLTADDLREGSPIREAIEDQLESWHSNYSTESGRITSYDDWIDRADGMEIPGESGVFMDFGDTYDHPTYRAIRKIAKSLAEELR